VFFSLRLALRDFFFLFCVLLATLGIPHAGARGSNLCIINLPSSRDTLAFKDAISVSFVASFSLDARPSKIHPQQDLSLHLLSLLKSTQSSQNPFHTAGKSRHCHGSEKAGFRTTGTSAFSLYTQMKCDVFIQAPTARIYIAYIWIRDTRLGHVRRAIPVLFDRASSKPGHANLPLPPPINIYIYISYTYTYNHTIK